MRDAEAPLHALDQWFFEKIRQPLSCAGALLRVVQLREAAQGAQAHAMAAGITDKLWSVGILSLVEAAEPKPGKRGPYKKCTAA
jgi:hypothetical protein